VKLRILWDGFATNRARGAGPEVMISRVIADAALARS
jgi:hypothetical protein